MDITSIPLGGRPLQPTEERPAASPEQERHPFSQGRESLPFSQVMEQARGVTNERRGLSPAADTLNLTPDNTPRRLERDLNVQNLQRLAQNMIQQSIQNVGTARMPVDTLSYAGELASQTLMTGMMLPPPDHSPSRKESEWEGLRPIRGPGQAEGSSLE